MRGAKDNNYYSQLSLCNTQRSIEIRNVG